MEQLQESIGILRYWYIFFLVTTSKNSRPFATSNNSYLHKEQVHRHKEANTMHIKECNIVFHQCFAYCIVLFGLSDVVIFDSAGFKRWLVMNGQISRQLNSCLLSLADKSEKPTLPRRKPSEPQLGVISGTSTDYPR